MTDKEALNELKDSIKGYGYQCHMETYSKAIYALERQIPKKLVETESYTQGCCPNCKRNIEWIINEYVNDLTNCPYCGQAIDRSDIK